jgi:excisionase family DNA binding protein
MVELQFQCACGNTMMRHLYSPAEAASYLGVSDQTLNRWRRQGWIRSHKVARGFYYEVEMLDESLALRGYNKIHEHEEIIRL